MRFSQLLALALFLALSIVGCSGSKQPTDTTVYPIARNQLPAEEPYVRNSYVQPPVITKPLPQVSNAPLIQPPADTTITVSPRLTQPRRRY